MTWYLETICYYYFFNACQATCLTLQAQFQKCARNPPAACQLILLRVRRSNSELKQFNLVTSESCTAPWVSWEGSCLINMRIMFFMSCFFKMNWIDLQLLTECEMAMRLWLNVTVNNWLTLPLTPFFPLLTKQMLQQSTPRHRFRASYRPGFTSSPSQLWALGLGFTSGLHHSSA